MDFKEIKNTKHYLYDDEKEFKVTHPNVSVRHNWRHGSEGEWVYTDDDFVCQILRKLDIAKTNGKKVPCIRTVCGTFVASDRKKEMLGENGIAENIYAFSGTNMSKERFNSKKRTSKELLFARYVASGINVIDAYKRVYPEANNDTYIKRRTDKLLKTEKIQKMVKSEILELLKEYKASPEYIIERYKTIADLAENDTHKLKALDSLAKMSGLFDLNETKSEQVTVWAGFSPEQLEEVKKHDNVELVAHAEKTKDD
tara:strand:- start:1960 stop:2727 length:768 start_codon:yes stop_codon:yes gene_type:complete